MKFLIFCVFLAVMMMADSVHSSLSGSVRASASCPGSVRLRSNARISGSGTISLRNNSSRRRIGSINIELCNSQNNCNRATDSYSISNRGTYRRNVSIMLNAYYARYGSQTATMRIRVDGLSTSGLGRCSFTVA